MKESGVVQVDDLILENYYLIEEDQEEYYQIVEEVKNILSENEVEDASEQNQPDYIILYSNDTYNNNSYQNVGLSENDILDYQEEAVSVNNIMNTPINDYSISESYSFLIVLGLLIAGTVYVIKRGLLKDLRQLKTNNFHLLNNH